MVDKDFGRVVKEGFKKYRESVESIEGGKSFFIGKVLLMHIISE